jgi:hypothetical protein
VADFKSTLVLRRNAAGQVRIQGDPPEQHVFPTSFIDRELVDDGAVDVQVTVKTATGPVRYRLAGFEQLDDGRPNWTGWICERVEG